MAPTNFSELIVIKYFVKYCLFYDFTVSNISSLIKLHVNTNHKLKLILKLFRILI